MAGHLHSERRGRHGADVRVGEEVADLDRGAGSPRQVGDLCEVEGHGRGGGAMVHTEDRHGRGVERLGEVLERRHGDLARRTMRGRSRGGDARDGQTQLRARLIVEATRAADVGLVDSDGLRVGQDIPHGVHGRRVGHVDAEHERR